MEPDQDELRQRMNRLKEAIRRSGIKLTHQRMEIFRQVAASGDHPDAETIYQGVRARMPTVSLDTVYRTLWLLLDLGLITTVGPPRERARFDANTAPHHHFVCTKCGVARDFYCEEFNQLTIPDAVEALGQVERTHVQFRGPCSRCRQRGQEAEPPGNKLRERRLNHDGR